MSEASAKPTVYVETTVVSYLCAQPSRDVVTAGHQQTTRDWWDRRGSFALRTSQLVVDEAAAGDPSAANQRLAVLADIASLEISEEALHLAENIVKEGLIPQSSAADALHIAIAVVTGCEYLVSWNHRYMVNALLRSRIENFCRAHGYEPTIICTPEELMED